MPKSGLFPFGLVKVRKVNKIFRDLPSLVSYHILHSKLTPGHSAYPFDYVVTRIFTSIFKIKLHKHEVQKIECFLIILSRKWPCFLNLIRRVMASLWCASSWRACWRSRRSTTAAHGGEAATATRQWAASSILFCRFWFDGWHFWSKVRLPFNKIQL